MEQTRSTSDIWLWLLLLLMLLLFFFFLLMLLLLVLWSSSSPPSSSSLLFWDHNIKPVSSLLILADKNNTHDHRKPFQNHWHRHRTWCSHWWSYAFKPIPFCLFGFCESLVAWTICTEMIHAAACYKDQHSNLIETAIHKSTSPLQEKGRPCHLSDSSWVVQP